MSAPYLWEGTEYATKEEVEQAVAEYLVVLLEGGDMPPCVIHKGLECRLEVTVRVLDDSSPAAGATVTEPCITDEERSNGPRR